MKEAIGVDHITLCVKNLAATKYLFTHILGFEVIWSAQDVGSDKSSMDTVVVQRGEAKIALMQGRNKERKSQICEFVETYGEGVQHIALEVDDIEAVCREWETRGVRFSGDIKDGRDGFGPLRQRFTYPLFPGCGLFLELTQRQHGQEESKTFVRATVESLYRDIERDQIKGVARTIIDYETLPLPFEDEVEAASLRHAS
jgi:methylmalonyl-CoA/ethylmalonyl-CoA epimerase